MTAPFKHEFFASDRRVSQTLRNDRCQNILCKAMLEHFTELKNIAALLLTSKSFQNSSFGANFILNWIVNDESIGLLATILPPSSCLSLQFVPSLHIKQWTFHSEQFSGRFSKFVDELVKTKYLHLQLWSLTLDCVSNEVLASFFGSSISNTWPQLRDLTLNDCDLSDTFVASITKTAVHLRTLNLSASSRIADAGLQHVAKLSGSTSLNLSRCCNSGDIDRQQNSKLSSNVITTNVSLSGKWSSSAGLKYVRELPGITSLNLDSCDFVTDADLQLISNHTGVKSLNLSGCYKITDVGLEHVATLSNITSLDLKLCRMITDRGLELVSTLHSITFLNLYHCRLVTDLGLEHISKLSSMTSLNLSDCDRVTDVGLRHLASLSRMKFLDVSWCHLITDAGLKCISELSGITSLNLHCCGLISDVGLEHLSKLCNISSLKLSQCAKITDVGIEHFSKLSELTMLNLYNCDKITVDAKMELKATLPLLVLHPF